MSLSRKLTIASAIALVILSMRADFVFAQQATVISQISAGRRDKVYQWFQNYDQIRRKAQMTPTERTQADQLLSQGMSIFAPSQDKEEAKQLLSKLVFKYRRAKAEMQALPTLPETQRLHRGYYQYFSTAGDLFADYLALQSNLFAKDPSTGRPIMGEMLERKEHLENLNNVIQDIDIRTRAQWGIPAYQYRPVR